MLRVFFEWWTRQWLALLPAFLKHDPSARDLTLSIPSLSHFVDGPITVSASGQAPQTFLFDSEGLAQVRALKEGRRLCLHLPAGILLERRVQLPAAAEDDLAHVLAYEMDRLTPFPATEVLWDWTLIHHDRQKGKLDIRLTLARRDGLGSLLAALEAAGLAPDRLQCAAARPDAPARTLWLHRRAGRAAPRPPLRLAAYGLCGFLLLVLCGMPFLRQQLRLAETARQIAQLQPQVQLAAALRHRIVADAESTRVLAAERRMTGNPLAVLAAVTQALPDDTWLTQLSLRQRALHMEGASHAAVQLIGRLSLVSLIGNPAFAAPVTTDSDHHVDLFAISAEVQP
ncbi:PilN domain-containing protein [Acidisoma sp. 7E03]